MTVFTENRHLPYTPQQLCDLAADVVHYPSFLPWCVATRVRPCGPNSFFAELVIGFRMIRERYLSKVTVDPGKRVESVLVEGPFHILNNLWIFEAAEDGGTNLNFSVEFEFRSKMLQKLIGSVFSEATSIMMSSFEKRARQLYGMDGRILASR